MEAHGKGGRWDTRANSGTERENNEAMSFVNIQKLLVGGGGGGGTLRDG